MKENTEEKNLTNIQRNSNILGKVLSFFRKIFNKKTTETLKTTEKENNRKEFLENLKVESDVEAEDELLELQRKVRDGIIKIEDLTLEQEDQLIDLYDKQIAVKRAKIEEIKKKIEKLKKQAS